MKYSLFLILLSSCSFFIKNIDQDILEEKQIDPLPQTKQTYCGIINKRVLIADSKNSIEVYDKFVNQLGKKIRLRFIDRVVLWSFVQMNARPDLSSPSGKYQTFLHINNKDYYYNTFSKTNEGYPQFHLMQNLLKQFGSKYSLYQLAEFFDKYFPQELTVTKSLEDFLSRNQLELKKNAIFIDYYIRGDETLKQNETLPKLRMRRLVQSFLKEKIPYEMSSFLFQSEEGLSLRSSCNFEMNLYKSSIFLINDKVVNSHIYGLKNRNNMFLGVAAQENQSIQPIGKSHLFKGQSNIRSAAMCSFQSLKNSDRFWFVSSQSRDPGQHIFHLMEYGLDEIDNTKSLDTMMKFSRHQFLKNPVRLVIESRRSSEKQINELLKLNIPIYNSKKLGKIWSYFKSAKESTFIIDDRRDGSIQCNSK